MLNEVWDEITYPFPNFNGCTVEVWEWINNFIPHFIMVTINFPCMLGLKFNHAVLVKGFPDIYNFSHHKWSLLSSIENWELSWCQLCRTGGPASCHNLWCGRHICDYDNFSGFGWSYNLLIVFVGSSPNDPLPISHLAPWLLPWISRKCSTD